MKHWKPLFTLLFFGAALFLGAQQIMAAQYAEPCNGAYYTGWYGNTASTCVASWQGAQVGAYAEAAAICGVRTRCGGTWQYAPFCQYTGTGYFTCVRMTGFGCTSTGLEP